MRFTMTRCQLTTHYGGILLTATAKSLTALLTLLDMEVYRWQLSYRNGHIRLPLLQTMTLNLDRLKEMLLFRQDSIASKELIITLTFLLPV